MIEHNRDLNLDLIACKFGIGFSLLMIRNMCLRGRGEIAKVVVPRIFDDNALWPAGQRFNYKNGLLHILLGRSIIIVQGD